MRFFLLLVAVAVTAMVMAFAPGVLHLVLMADGLFAGLVVWTANPLKAGVW
jgi:hypothetical protein